MKYLSPGKDHDTNHDPILGLVHGEAIMRSQGLDTVSNNSLIVFELKLLVAMSRIWLTSMNIQGRV